MKKEESDKVLKKKNNRSKCGNGTVPVIDGHGMLKYVPYQCKQVGCEKCRPGILKQKQQEVRSMLNGTQEFYAIEVQKGSYRGLTNKIRGRNYLGIPGTDTILFIFDQPVEYKGDDAYSLNRHEALGVVTAEENIFTPTRRLTGGDWKLSSKSDKKESLGEISFERLIPFLDPPGGDTKQLYLLDQFRAVCNVWTKGKLDPTDEVMVQDYVDHMSSVVVEMALREGFKLNHEMSYVRKEIVKIETIANWIGASIDTNVTYFTNESKRVINGVSPHLIPILTGHGGIKNWRKEFLLIKYGANSFDDYGLDPSLWGKQPTGVSNGEWSERATCRFDPCHSYPPNHLGDFFITCNSMELKIIINNLIDACVNTIPNKQRRNKAD